MITLADNTIIPGSGAGVAGVTDAVHRWGSVVQGFRNIEIPIDGAGVAGDIGNGAQNQWVHQTDTQASTGSTIGIADNANIPGDGAGVAGVIGNGSQNGWVKQNKSGDPGDG